MNMINKEIKSGDVVSVINKDGSISEQKMTVNKITEVEVKYFNTNNELHTECFKTDNLCIYIPSESIAGSTVGKL